MPPGRLRGRFADFRSSSDCPRLQPDPVVLRQLDRIVETFTNEAADLRFSEGFVGVMTDHFAEAFRRLDAIDRDDPLWEGTNRRPTLHKLHLVYGAALRADPVDRVALWLKVAIQTVGCSYFDPDPWERLVSACRVDPTWIVNSALLAECVGSYDTVIPLAKLARRVPSCHRIMESLGAIIDGEQEQPNRMTHSWEYALSWVRRVLAEVHDLS